MKIGKLYQIKKYYWLLYPSQEKAVEYAQVRLLGAATTTNGAIDEAAFWSKRLSCNVSYIKINSMFCLLEKNDISCKILLTDGHLGWIIHPENEDWTNGCIEEAKL